MKRMILFFLCVLISQLAVAQNVPGRLNVLMQDPVTQRLGVLKQLSASSTAVSQATYQKTGRHRPYVMTLYDADGYLLLDVETMVDPGSGRPLIESRLWCMYDVAIDFVYVWQQGDRSWLGSYFVFPAGSRTGWGNTDGRGEVRKKLPWIPAADRVSANCKNDVSVSYKVDKEYMTTLTCFRNDAAGVRKALELGKAFVDYVGGTRPAN